MSETKESTGQEQEPVADNAQNPSVPVSEEDKVRTGDRDVAIGKDAISKEPDEENDGPAAMPSFFVLPGKDKFRVEVDILSSRKTGRVLSVSRKDIGIDFAQFKNLVHTEAWFEFTVPDYNQISTYRKRCGVWQEQAQMILVDKLQMRDYYIVWHLRDTSLTDAAGKKVNFTFDEDGSLDKASMKVAYSLHPTVMDVVMTVFEKDALLT